MSVRDLEEMILPSSGAWGSNKNIKAYTLKCYRNDRILCVWSIWWLIGLRVIMTLYNLIAIGCY